ncbi:rhomboid family intramembrane serine protease [Clostridium chromiireducens]|uniref:rhomboid family intramembrane serine protease n=1 Tax=Clostridium chromiireducens TaxID=225345 RepID=UPI003AF8E970
MSKKVSLKQHIGVTTVCIICITTVFTLLQFIYPQMLSSLRRNPTALYSGQWWRLFTPLLVHSDKNAWVQFIINMLGIAVLGTAVERLVGRYKFLLLYLAGGLAGEIAGYCGWDPFGAGASVGLCGLLGGLFILFIKGKSKMTPIIPVISLYFIVGLLGNASGSYVFTILICLSVSALQILAMKNKENINNINSENKVDIL